MHTNDNKSENEKNQIKSRGASTNPLLSSIYWVAFCNIFAKASFGFTWPKSGDQEYFLKANIFAIILAKVSFGFTWFKSADQEYFLKANILAIFLQRRLLVSLDPNPLIRNIFSRQIFLQYFCKGVLWFHLTQTCWSGIFSQGKYSYNIFAKASFGFTWPKSADQKYFLTETYF